MFLWKQDFFVEQLITIRDELSFFVLVICIENISCYFFSGPICRGIGTSKAEESVLERWFCLCSRKWPNHTRHQFLQDQSISCSNSKWEYLPNPLSFYRGAFSFKLTLLLRSFLPLGMKCFAADWKHAHTFFFLCLIWIF